MKKILFFSLSLLFSAMLFAGDLVMMNVEKSTSLIQLFEKSDLKIHYYNDRFVIATADRFDSETMILLDENAFSETQNYFIVYCTQNKQSEYLQREKLNGKVLFQNSELLIMKPLNSQLLPAKNDGMVAISNKTAILSKSTTDYPVVTEEDTDIRAMMDLVMEDSVLATIQHLQDYGTRFYNSDEVIEAQNWLASRYEALGLEVTLQDVYIYGNPTSSNVIAIQQGTLYPDEYVVCGGHYDSFTYEAWYSYGTAPGADDNASGTAGILETARILSQFQFERSIIYCAFSGEELGLYGSEAYASYCQNQGMNIVGYFNLDMTGYLQEGDLIHIDLIYPTSATALANFYLNVCEIYYPEMNAAYAYLEGGDSDHTSFNNHGYQGIFPFEDADHHSPHIHTTNDLIGPSVNNAAQVKRFTEINLAAVATLAFPVETTTPCQPVTLSVALENSNSVLTWNEIENAVSYTIYYDGEILATDIVSTTYTHENLSSGTHCYTVKTICEDEQESELSEESCSEIVSIDEYHNRFQIYPNPANQQCSIVGNNIKSVTIYNLTGQYLETVEAGDTNCVINTTNYNSGIYIVRILTKENVNVTKRIEIIH